jgi:presenilin-like A22 family membrane protease
MKKILEDLLKMKNILIKIFLFPFDISRNSIILSILVYAIMLFLCYMFLFFPSYYILNFIGKEFPIGIISIINIILSVFIIGKYSEKCHKIYLDKFEEDE